MLVLLPLCRHLEPISLLAQGFCWCSLEVVLGMAAGSLQLPLHSSELQGSGTLDPKLSPHWCLQAEPEHLSLKPPSMLGLCGRSLVLPWVEPEYPLLSSLKYASTSFSSIRKPYKDLEAAMHRPAYSAVASLATLPLSTPSALAPDHPSCNGLIQTTII